MQNSAILRATSLAIAEYSRTSVGQEAMLKHLRIAVTALSLTACVLLLALWVRSYHSLDLVRGHVLGVTDFGVVSQDGKFFVAVFAPATYSPRWVWFRGGDSGLGVQLELDLWKRPKVIPHWLLMLTTAAFAPAPWLRWRFSLRTLLIATTLVAVGMRLVMYLVR